MANGSVMALKLVLRGFGVNPDELEKKLQDAVALVQEFDLNELRAALQLLLDYQKHEEQNSLRMKAIMDHLGIVDTCLSIVSIEKENDDD